MMDRKDWRKGDARVKIEEEGIIDIHDGGSEYRKSVLRR